MKTTLRAALIVLACAGPVKAEQIGIASYYGNKFNGKKTASGQRFDQRKLTAAHRTLRFGSRVSVTNLRNGKTVIVTVNDRGPFVRGRVIDLSLAAARQIGLDKSGVTRVKIRVIRG